MTLVALKKTTDGRYQLTFGDKATATHDAVVLAIPATVIRARVTLDCNLGIAPQTRAAITGLQYGDNTKTMFQFESSEPFAALGGDGTAYATDPALPNVQVAFPSKTAAPGADPTMPVIVDYGFGERGRLLTTVDPDGSGFLGGYDAIFPGAAAAAVPLLNSELFARAHWPSEPNALGSYTCNQPGYFTTMEGWLGEPAGNLAFAGEHTGSFHNFQGFIEGAALSGIRAAEYLLARVRSRLL
jgi:monoamine oxidase